MNSDKNLKFAYIAGLTYRLATPLTLCYTVKRSDKTFSVLICIGYHMRGEVISVLSLEGRYHILSRVSAANEGQNTIS